MIGSLDLIRTEPYQKQNFEKPRRLQETQSIYIKYGENITVNLNTDGVYVDANADPSNGNVINAGQVLTIEFSAESEIHNAEITNFFQNFDTNYKSITYVDLSNMKFSSTTLATLFIGCESLERAFISFATDDEISLSSMFDGSGLKVLDISGLKISDESYPEQVFGSLIYLDVRNATLTNGFKNDFRDHDDLAICQDSPTLIRFGFDYICCDYKNGNEETCKDNYITIFLEDDSSSFKFEKVYKYMSLAVCEDGQYTSEELASGEEYDYTIQVGKKLIIYFCFMKTLDGLFEENNDIKKVDLTHFDFSEVTSAKTMFKKSSLQSIDLSNINAPKLTDISSMFQGCEELLSVNLNNFNASNVNNMEYIFDGCYKLNVLELSGFDFRSIEQPSSPLFSDNNPFPELIYLNVKDVNFQESIRNQFINSIILKKGGTIICHNDTVLSQKKNQNQDEKNEYWCCSQNYYLDMESCESFNFITVQYKLSNVDLPYNQGFGNKRSEEIMYIKKGDTVYKPDEALVINKDNTNIEIYFSEGVKSLKNMFSSEIDENVEYIESIDFSNFDTSLVADMSNLFHGCKKLYSVDLSNFNTKEVTNMNSMFASSSLISIDLYNFNTSKVTDMGSMFEGCSELTFVKLHHFNTSLVTDMSKMFYNCELLIFIDISCFNFQNVINYTEMFHGFNLMYINLYNVENSKDIITSNSDLNNMNQLKVCQKELLITNEDITNDCYYLYRCPSEEYDFRTGCTNSHDQLSKNSSNLFRISFASDVVYPNGFGNENRKNIRFIIDKDYLNVSSPSDNITFIAGNVYEIFINSPIGEEELDNYFNANDDTNLKQIKSIDVILPNSSSVTSLESMFDGCSSLESVSLVYINTSSVESFKAMFRGCSALKSIDLSHFNTPQLTNMNNMFSGCSSLEFLDLSYFDTSNVHDMNGMFFKCNNLKVLDISSFNMKSMSSSNIFSNLINLKYINLYDVEDTNYIINDSHLKYIKNLTVCQKEEIIKKETMDFYDTCCYYNISTNSCEADNYMLIYYDQAATYENGFSFNANTEIELKFRNEDYFIINGDYLNKKSKDDILFISKGSKLELYFNKESKIESFKNYFNVEFDTNAKKIKKVDLSHLDLSLVESTSSMFYGCNSLLSVDFSNVETPSLTSMDYMFYKCTSLVDVDLLYFNTSLVENMENMFYGCESIEIIDLSYFNTSSVNSMANMFNGCKNLLFLDISSFILESDADTKNMFNDSERLSYLNLLNTKKIFNKSLRADDEDFSFYSEVPYVCQKEKIIFQNNYDECFYFNISNHTNDLTGTEQKNFIIIYFEKETIYKHGFINDNNGNKIRGDEIDFIINGKHTITFKSTDRLIIRKGKRIEVYFSNVTNLESFFSAKKDPNMENVASIDLSHFDTSFVTSMASMFNGCYSLKSIDLYDINTSLVTDMNNMFKDCKALKVLELSFFNTSLVKNMDSMFNGCESLIYLDISNFNLESVTNFDSVFTGDDNLQYVNLYYIKNSYEYITNSELNDLEEVTICQKEYLVTNENATYDCCYYDIVEKKCINNNFAVIYFSEYSRYHHFDYFDYYYRGFQCDFRKNISFIINRERDSPFSATDILYIKKGHKIEVYFSDITNLENFFNSYEDENMAYVISMDLSNLKTSFVTTMESLFYGCMFLKSIDLSNIDTSSVKYMNNMFYNCISLESIDLSFFNTSLVEDMSKMFHYCQSLKIIDLSYFDTSKVTDMSSMFEGCYYLQLLDISRFNLEALELADGMFLYLINITYINLYYVQDSKGFINESMKIEEEFEKEFQLDKSKLTVCQKENIITNIINNKCCYYNVTSQECINQNYITIFFGDKAIYNNGFENDFREGIEFIINGEEHNKKLAGKDKLHLHRGSKLEIYFSDDTLSLRNYFSTTKDANMKNLLSVYLSNLNSIVSGNLDNLFYGCESLKTVIDLNDIKTLPIINMSYMFYNCKSLEFLDLSIFNTSSVQNMKSLFEKCSSLKYLDISHFNLENCSIVNRMFTGVNNLGYINVYNVQDPEKKLLNYNFPSKSILTVCQKEDYKIISNDNTKCCYYNMSSKECEDTNFIILYFGEDVEYLGYGNDDRNGIFNYVVNNYHNTKLKIVVSEQNVTYYPRLKIKKGHKFEIYFNSPLDTLEEYFSPSYDSNMKYLVSVDLSNFDTSELTYMASAFADCELLNSVDFYNFQGSSIINMNYLFSNCVSLKSIDFSHLEPTLVVYMNNMFSGCISLESIKFSSSEATSLVNLKEMFKGCSSIKSIDLSNFITTSATYMDYMFSGCSSLKYLDISNFIMEKVTNANSMFEDVISLKYINLYRAKDYNSYISKSELNDLNILTVCQSEQILTKDDVINKCCKYNITIDQCEDTNYIEIYYKEDVYYDGDFTNCSRKDINYIIIGEKQFSVNDNFDISSNTKVEIHFKNKSESLSNFFCSDDDNTQYIVSIDLSYLDTSELKDISSMFSGCTSLNSINLIYFNTSSVINMNSLFKGCTQLESIDLSNFETSSVKDMSRMFYGCSNLKSINFSTFDTSSVDDMSYMFYQCNSIASLDLSNFDTSKVTIFSSIFYNCTNLKVLDISHFELGKDATYKNMFRLSTNLRYINLYYVIDTDNKFPDSDITKITDINVCQNINERIVESENIIERCCYYNIITDKCENSNYIVITFNNYSDTTYEKGFLYGIFEDPLEDREGKIDFILYNNKKYNGTDKLSIKAGSKIEIYLTNVTSLRDFFNFGNDANLENIISVDFSHLYASNITDLSSLFWGCENLLSVDFSNFNSSSLIKMDYMFSGCESIISINLSNFNTSLVTDMSNLFYGCRDLKYIYLSNLDTSKVENMTYMFSDCSSLVSLDLSYFNTSSLTNINRMFNGCKELKVLDISYFNLDNITNYENIFYNVKTLKYINVYNVEDKNGIIKGSDDISSLKGLIVCEKEEEIILPTIDTDRKRSCCYFNISKESCEYDNYILIYYGKESVYNMGFNNKYRNGVEFIINGDYINNLTNEKDFKVNAGCKIAVYFKSSEISTLESFFDSNHDINIGNIKSIDLSHFNPSSQNSVNMKKAFSSCISLESITFNDLLVGNMNNMFSGCYSLKSINLTLLDLSEATDTSYMFYKCESLESIDLPFYNVSQINDMSYMFYDCISLKSIDLTHLDASHVTDMSYMFYGCTSLMYTNTSNLNIASITKMNHMFYNCSSLESTIDFSLYKTSPLTNLEQMFYGCGNLTSINLSKFDTTLVTSMKEIFYGCNNMKYIDISNFDMSNCVFYSDMFSNISNIIYIDLFNLKNDKMISEVFKYTNNLIFICQSEEIIKNKKALNCCEFNFDINECENMPKTIITTIIEKSTFINPQSTINNIFTDKTILTDEELITTDFIKDIDTTFVKETKETSTKSTYISKETEGFTDIRSTINKKPTTFIAKETTQLESTLLEEEKADSTTNYIKDSTNILEILFNTSNIETTPINIPTTNPLFDTTSLNEKTTTITSKSSTQSLSTNENEFLTTNKLESTSIPELKTTSFTEMATSII